MIIVTCVAAAHQKDFDSVPVFVRDKFSDVPGASIQTLLLSPAKAIQIYFEGEVLPESITPDFMAHMREALGMDVFAHHVNDLKDMRKKLLLADMDSTIVAEETLDEVAAYAGLKEKIAAITARSMRGEINFTDSVKQRVALLKGLPITALEDTLKAMHYNQGAQTLIATLRANACRSALVSGGFTFFTEKVALSLGFDEHHGNTLMIDNDLLTGMVVEPIQDKSYKASLLHKLVAKHGFGLADTLCVGDGANDEDMLMAAQANGGLGIGYYPKPILKEKLINSIEHTDLSSLLYVQGYSDDDFVFEIC
jgi:phosphoserine phosphatase